MPSTSPSKDYEKKKSLILFFPHVRIVKQRFCVGFALPLLFNESVESSNLFPPPGTSPYVFLFLVTFPTFASFFLYILEPVRAPSLFVYCSFSVTRLFVRTFLSTFFSSDFRSWVFIWLSFAIRYRRRRHYSPKS